MTTSITDFFEQLKRASKQAPKHNDPHNVDEIELILSEYFTIHPNHIALRIEFKKFFDQYPKTSPRWIILSCWQTGNSFKEVHSMQYRLTVNKTYELAGMLKAYDKRYNTDIGKNMLVFVAGMYLWNKYTQRYWVSYLNG